MITLDAKMAFNDVSFGFVPHGGSSFYLSRLPNEIGTFLALTGFPLPVSDIMDFKLADKLIHLEKDFDLDVAEYLTHLEMPIPDA